MSSIKGSSLRIGGLNSGLDTEAIVNAMSASTKLRITTNQRQVLRLEAQQTAYRSIIDKFNGFRDKYFDRLNNNTFLRSRATFNRHMATITQNGAKVTPAGVSVRANANATAGTYNVEVVSHATQAKITSASMDSLNPDFDLSQYEDGQARAMSVTVGGTTRWISFSGDTDADVRTSINHALAKAFGSANNTGTFDSNGNFVPGSGTGIGRVFLNADGKFESTDKAAISTGAIAELNDTVDLGALSGWETGNNSITLVIDGQARTVNFQTVAANYFNDLGFVQNNDGTWTVVGGSQESINAFNAIVTEMYNKQRSDAFDAWLDSVNHNENFRSVVLTQAQRRTALEDAGFDFTGVTDIDAHIDALTSNDNTNIAQRDAARNALTNALDAESLRIRVSALQGWAGDEGIDTTGVNWTNAASVNSFINANEGASAIANNATFNHIYNNQMTDQQKALFDEEVARRNAATRQTEFDRAVSELYNSFDTWQRSIIGASIVPNPDFNPMLPPSAANPATIQNPDYLFMDQWRTMMGLNDIDVEALYTTHGDDWAENILNITESNIPFLAQLTAGTGPFAEMTAAEREELLETWDDLKDAAEERLNGAATTAYNGKIYEHHRLGFLQTGYSERTAFFNSYADGTAIPGNSYNDFFQQQVVGIPGTADAFTAADRAAALVAAGFAGAAGLTTDAEIDAFLASSAMNHSDLSRLHAALLTQRTNAVNNGAGAYNGAENLGRGLTTYERIAILQAQGINTSGITNATNHGDITDFINSSALTDAQRTAVENAMVAARNNKIQAVNLSPEQTIAALAAAGINTSGITDPTDIDEINDFISENVTAQTDRQKANAAIDEARREHFDDLPKTPNPTMTPEALARFFNDSSIEEILNNVTFADGTKIEANVTGGNLILTAYREDADGNRLPAPVPMGFITNEGSDNSFGGPTQGTTVSSVSQSTRLGELGLKDDEGNNITNFTFSVNGVNFSFDANTTIRDMMGSVNNNTSANVQMTFSTLTNSFEIMSREFGADADLNIQLGNLLDALGFTGAPDQYKQGQNMVLNINSERVETASNTFEVNGLEITIGPNAVTGAAGAFEIVVERDTSQMFDMIKSFVEDYNALIDYVFGYVSEKPDREYFFLTDTDREELGMSDRQEQKWEERAMKGLLYNDRTITRLMSDMRVAMFSGVDRGLGDGSMFGLFSMGISTSSNWLDNGKLIIDETRLKAAIDNDIDLVTELFTNVEKGIMPQLQDIINSATRTTGERWERGLLIQRAGIANGTSATSNALYDQIKRLNTVIANLELRYQRQQDRYWKIFAGLETQMGQLNSQHDFIAQMGMANLWGGGGR